MDCSVSVCTISSAPIYQNYEGYKLDETSNAKTPPKAHAQ